MGSFRCHGRTMWVCVYYMMIIVPIVLHKCVNRIATILILAGTLVLQIIDLSTFLEYKYEFVNSQDRIKTEFDEIPEINNFALDSSIRNVVLYKNTFEYLDDYDSITDAYAWAIEHGKTINHIYLAREDSRYSKRTEDELNNPKDYSLFILSASDKDICERYGLYYIELGRYLFAQNKPFNN